MAVCIYSQRDKNDIGLEIYRLMNLDFYLLFYWKAISLISKKNCCKIDAVIFFTNRIFDQNVLSLSFLLCIFK